MANPYSNERKLIEHIRQNVTGIKECASVTKLSGYQMGQVPTDSIYVQYAGGRIEDIKGDENLQKEKQLWKLVLAVENLEDPQDEFNTAAFHAGQLLEQLQPLLVGWRPQNGFDPFMYRGLDEPYYEPGYAEFPALFETGYLITGNN